MTYGLPSSGGNTGYTAQGLMAINSGKIDIMADNLMNSANNTSNSNIFSNVGTTYPMTNTYSGLGANSSIYPTSTLGTTYPMTNTYSGLGANSSICPTQTLGTTYPASTLGTNYPLTTGTNATLLNQQNYLA